MRLAYFTNTYPRATDTFIRREVIGLRRRGLDVLTYSVRKTGADHDVDAEVIAEKKSTKYLFPIKFSQLIKSLLSAALTHPGRFFSAWWLAQRSARPGLRGFFLQQMYFLEAVMLAKLLKEDGIDHAHNHLGDNSGTVTMLAAKIADISYSISIHGPHIFFDGPNWALDKKTEHARFISCIGHFCTSQMMLYADKTQWSKFKIIRCGVDIEQFDYRPPSGAASKLAYVGRLSAEKGLPILFESLAVMKQRGAEAQLTVMGDGPDRSYLEEMTEKMGLSEQVQFAGFVDQATIAANLRASDIFVLPSFAEGIPVALMEAMAIGLPVIATYVGGVTELVVDGETGQVVNASDPIDLARAIEKYVREPEFCATVATNARKRVESEFNIEDQVDKLAELFSACEARVHS